MNGKYWVGGIHTWDSSVPPEPQRGILTDHVVFERTVLTAGTKISFPLKPTGKYQMTVEMFRLRLLAQVHDYRSKQ